MSKSKNSIRREEKHEQKHLKESLFFLEASKKVLQSPKSNK